MSAGQQGNTEMGWGKRPADKKGPRQSKEGKRKPTDMWEQFQEHKGQPDDKAGQIIGIRADANGTVATGHIMRCITIAKQLKRKGCRVVFFTADEYACGLLGQAGMDMVCLHSRWDNMEEEIPLLRTELGKVGCGKLLVDSYQASVGYFDKLRDLCKLAYIDDCFEAVYPVDLLVNYNAYHVRFPYGEAYQGGTGLLLGTSYVPLREEFQRQKIADGGVGRGRAADTCREEFQKQGNVDAIGNAKGVAACESDGKKGEFCRAGEKQHVLLSSGGGDAYNALAGVLAEAVKDELLSHVVFHTVVGRFNNHAEQLEQLAGNYPNIHLHREVKNMAGLMEKCSAAVSAAGTVLFELSAMGVPTVFFVSADNQQYDSEFFAVEDRMLFAGDIRTGRQICIEGICNGLKRILGDLDLQRHMKMALRRVTDGKGAERIAEALLGL